MSNTERTTRPVDAHRAGRFVLAVADGSTEATIAVLTEASGEPRGVVNLCLELASIGIGLAEQHEGPLWRSVLGSALADLEMQHLDQLDGS